MKLPNAAGFMDYEDVRPIKDTDKYEYLEKAVRIAEDHGFSSLPLRRREDFSMHTLNPLFWQALAEALNKDPWKSLWMSYTAHLIEGGDIEGFFKDIL